MNWIAEIAKAGVFALLGGLAGFFLGPPLKELDTQRSNCAEIVRAENAVLALVANPSRVPDLLTRVDSEVHIVRTKAGEMGIDARDAEVPRGPGSAAVKDFLVFAERNNYNPKDFSSSSEHVKRINAVQQGCKKQYSSLLSIPLNVFGLW